MLNPYTLPYVIIALHQGAEYATDAQMEYLLNAAISTKEDWQNLEYGPDASKGGNLSTIYLTNLQTNPTLLCAYTDGDKYTLNYTALPLDSVMLKGEGTIENHYCTYQRDCQCVRI